MSRISSTSSTTSRTPHRCTPAFATGAHASAPFNQLNHLHNDACFVSAETAQSTEPGMYKLHNFYGCTTEQTMGIALNQPLTQFRDGFGTVGQQGQHVDVYSQFRNGKEGGTLTHARDSQTLNERPYLTVPFMGRGIGNPDTELALKEGTTTFERKECNTLAEVHLPHQYVPMVDCLRNEIQNPVHILPEDNQRDWTRGGYPSRQLVHSREYTKDCCGGGRRGASHVGRALHMPRPMSASS